MAYMKKVTDATTDVGYGDGWFKIQHAGLLNSASKPQALHGRSSTETNTKNTAQNWATTALV